MADEKTSIWLTDKVVEGLPLPERGTARVYDAPHPKQGWTSGFGVRVAAGGTKSFVLRYRSRETRREHMFSIGSWPAWSVQAARAEARELKRRVEQGGDPQTERRLASDAPTVAELADRFLQEHASKRRPSTAKGYRSFIESHIRPALGRRLVAAVSTDDIERLHRLISETAPFSANRTVATASKMFSFAIRLKWRADNPCKGIEKNAEPGRRRYLSGDELARLTEALAGHGDQQGVANVFRMLLLTGARKGEVLSARWEQFDFGRRVWVKPAHSTKQRREHETPLGTAALQLLNQMRQAAPADAVYLFPSHGSSGHLTSIDEAWAAICKRAGIFNLRIHDLRHSFASELVSAGFSLPVIGSLLGHSTVQTTSRYSHLYDDVSRAAANKIGARMAGLVAKPPTKGKRKLRVVR